MPLVRRVRDLGPDVALLDFAMPVLNGLDAAREVARSRFPSNAAHLVDDAQRRPRREDVARLLGVSVKTAAAHRTRIMAKLDIHEIAGLVRYVRDWRKPEYTDDELGHSCRCSARRRLRRRRATH